MIIPYTLNKTGVQSSLVSHTDLCTEVRISTSILVTGFFKLIDTDMVPKNVNPLSTSAGTRVNIHSSDFNFPDITQAFHIFFSSSKNRNQGGERGVDSILNRNIYMV